MQNGRQATTSAFEAIKANTNAGAVAAVDEPDGLWLRFGGITAAIYWAIHGGGHILLNIRRATDNSTRITEFTRRISAFPASGSAGGTLDAVAADVDGRVILDVGALADADTGDVATDDHLIPDRRITTSGNVTDQNSVGSAPGRTMDPREWAEVVVKHDGVWDSLAK